LPFINKESASAALQQGVGMKRLLFATFLLIVLSFPLTGSSSAFEEGPSATGNFQISLGQGLSRDIKFNANTLDDGRTGGEITFQDSGTLGKDAKATGETEASDASRPFYAKASCDCLFVQGVEAVLSGTVTESSRKSFIGSQVLVVVQDGDSLTPPLRDKLTFGFYRATTKGWIPTDEERPDEPAALTWVATDSERPEEGGVLNENSERVNCRSFPLTSHNFISAKEGKGKIQVAR
jgi:hypothetical protein